MRVIKRLDRFILQKFLWVFMGAFFICLFVFMMQFTWRYVDELIGKGLSLDILAKFFWYMGITLIPTALPLAVLLASLITFGNMGEQLELLAMKAAGVPLIRIMRPILLIVVLLTGLSFYFQNSISPAAQISFRTLLISMKQASPALEIPEGEFYNGVPKVNLYVEKKVPETGMLYQVIIYKTDQGFDRAQIVLADSGRLKMTEDKLNLTLDLWSGEQYESLRGQQAMNMSNAEEPYDRETFDYKQLIIDFDANFNVMDEEMLRDMPQAKNMKEIASGVDSMRQRMDSIGRANLHDAQAAYWKRPAPKAQAQKGKAAAAASVRAVPADSLLSRFDAARRQEVAGRTRAKIESARSDVEWKAQVAEDSYGRIRRHWVEWHQKMTLSLACLFFFFVGAPLGAIIRKGGLGMPTVVSVLIFIFYYIINTSGMKMARDGSWSMIYGMWISSAVLLPFGIYLTIMANRDSIVFNWELYQNFLRRLLGLRTDRHIYRKEVIIQRPRYPEMLEAAQRLREGCRRYNAVKRLYLAPGYINTFFRYKPDAYIEDLNARMEAMIEELSNSRSNRIIHTLNQFPLIYTKAHTSPFHSRRRNVLAGIILPLGLVLWVRIWRFRLRLLGDLRQIVKCCDALEHFIPTLDTYATQMAERTVAEQKTSTAEIENTAEEISPEAAEGKSQPPATQTADPAATNTHPETSQ